MIGEMASRSSLELPGRQLELLQAVVATGTPVVLLVMNGRPLDLRWAARTRAGDPRHLVPRHAGRRGRGEPAVRRRLARRQAALHLAADRRPGADDLRAHPLARAGEPGPPVLGRGQHAAVPVRVRPELRPVRLRRPHRRRADHHHRRDRHGVGRRSPTPPTGRPTRSSSSTCTSATAPRHVPSASSRASSGSPSRPASPGPSRSRSARTSGGTGTPPPATGSPTPSTFDVWVGGDSTAQLTTTIEITGP